MILLYPVVIGEYFYCQEKFLLSNRSIPDRHSQNSGFYRDYRYQRARVQIETNLQSRLIYHPQRNASRNPMNLFGLPVNVLHLSAPITSYQPQREHKPNRMGLFGFSRMGLVG